MFAFAVWDDEQRTLTLARDRVGIKPLYYSQLKSANGVDDSFAFASEVKAILATGLVRASLNFEALNQYLTFLWTPDPHTLFANVWKLPPGHFLTVQDGRINLGEWWDISFDEIAEGRSETWWRDRVLETLDRVVKLEMVADVPLGSFLSGGVDSSSIVALMRRHSNGKSVSTYTVGMAAEDLHYDIVPDDVVWARRVSDLLQTDYHEIMLQADVATLLPKLIYHADEPIADPAMLSSFLISQAARETLRVMLSGMGGDEVFAGYPRHMAMRVAGALDLAPGLLRRPVLKVIADTLPGGRPGKLTAPLRNAKKFARSAALDFEDRYLGYGTYFTDEMKHRLYSDEWREITRDYDAYDMHRVYFDWSDDAAPLNRLLYVDMKTFLPCLNLMTTDKTSMAANLEVRVPFLNREMIEMAARMPPRLKLHGLKRKYILKRALEGVLAKDVIWRRKAGFGAPIRSWLRGPLKPLISDLLSEDVVKRRGLFRPKEVKRVIDANISGREDYNLHVFHLLGLELWHRAFIDS